MLNLLGSLYDDICIFLCNFIVIKPSIALLGYIIDKRGHIVVVKSPECGIIVFADQNELFIAVGNA